MSFFKPPVNFSLNTASLFSVIIYNSSVMFLLKQYKFCSKGASELANFETFECCVKTRQIPHVIFLSISQFLPKFCIILPCYDRYLLQDNKVQIFRLTTSCIKIHQIPSSLFSVMRHNCSVLSHLKLFHLKKGAHQIIRLSTTCMKLNQILYVIFQASQFSFKF